MTKKIEEYFSPWVKGIPMYVSPHIELAWQKPDLHRMMSNENPNAPSEKVMEAITKFAGISNRYPDQGLMVRSRIAEINGLEGPENVMLGNGSSEVFDNIFRSFLGAGEEVIQHTPCFGIYKLRCNILGGELVSVPMVYKDQRMLFDPGSILESISEKTKIIVIANPNNPTGNFMDPEHFVTIAET
ncbi:MAG: aminotransferase class I/II-fold pyridoxal phosphate-dependent enzyme, partial [Anaerolineales bacterium]|nr:aminotransferase class I/II-fold pyridoxal phosphate-dependent enzyme [Anaerolineales bacterium]